MDEQSRDLALRFDAVVGAHFERLYRAAMRLTRCREDAEDLVQEVLLRALAELDRLATLESACGWLLRVQYHLFVDGVRRQARSPLARGNSQLDPGEAASEAPGPEKLTELEHRHRQLAGVWQELSRRQRALLALHAEGYTLAELEQITGLSKNAIGVRLHRARAQLASLISNETPSDRKLG
jgi:RNA polymerase sigma-70 factor (ECF subfamily)